MSEEEKTEKLKEFSPVYRMRGETFFHRLSATSLLPPVNLLHGTADNTVRRGTGRRGGCEKDAYCVCEYVCVYCRETCSSTPLLSPLPFFLSNTTVLNYSPTHSSLHAAVRPLSLCRSQMTTDGYTNIGYTILLPPFVVYHGRSQTTTVKTSPLRFETPDVRTSASSFTLARATQSKG